MTNLEALRSACKEVASSFYPDRDVLEYVLFRAHKQATGESDPDDIEIIKLALKLASGFVETSRSEGQESVASKLEAVKANIKRICGEYGLDASAYVKMSSIRDASNLW